MIGKPIGYAVVCLLVAFAAGFCTPARVLAAEDGYLVHGVTRYDAGDLIRFAHSHIQYSEGFVTAERMAEGIELVYREDGYFLAEAVVVPEADGSIVVVVDEGRIDSVVVEGVDEKVHARIEAYVQALIGHEAITQAEFERVLMFINDLAGVTAVTEFDYPDAGRGARLTITARQTLQSGSLTVDNPPREFGKALSLYGTQEFYSVFSGGDLLRFEGSYTRHFGHDGSGKSLSGNIFYRTPLGPDGAYSEFFGGNVVGRRDATGKYAASELSGLEYGAAIGYPVYRDIHDYRYAVFEARHSAVEATGGGLDFESAVNAVSVMALAGHDNDEGAPARAGLILTAGWRHGDVPVGEDDGDDSYWHIRASYGTSQHLPDLHHDLSYRFEVNGQYSPDRLPSVEEIYLGSRNMLRGYRFGEAAGDTGFASILELNRSWPQAEGFFTGLNNYIFLDTGHVKNNAPGAFEFDDVTLASVGIGFRANLQNDFSVHGHVGVPLLDGPFTDKYEPSLYLGVSKRW